MQRPGAHETKRAALDIGGYWRVLFVRGFLTTVIRVAVRVHLLPRSELIVPGPAFRGISQPERRHSLGLVNCYRTGPGLVPSGIQKNDCGCVDACSVQFDPSGCAGNLATTCLLPSPEG